MRKFFLKHLELLLSSIGLVLIFAIPYALRAHADVWQVAAITATSTGLIHGLIFWGVRRRQRVVREKAIADIKEMLNDVLLNQLASISLNAQMIQRTGTLEKYLARIERSLTQMTLVVNNLSGESLEHWQARYNGDINDLPDGIKESVT